MSSACAKRCLQKLNIFYGGGGGAFYGSVFSSAVPSGSGAFQMPTRPLSAAASTLMPASDCPEMVARWLHKTSIYCMFNFVFTSPEFSRIWVKCTMIARSSRRDHGEHGHSKELVRSQYGYIDFLAFFHA